MTHLSDITAFDRPIGSAIHYRLGAVNRCPDCGGFQWLVGRTTAQCAQCDTALPLPINAQRLTRPLFVTRPAAVASHS